MIGGAAASRQSAASQLISRVALAAALGLALVNPNEVLAAPPSRPSIDEPAYYPEGPAVAGGALYWAEMPRDRIRRLHNGRQSTVLTRPGCGPTSIKPDGRG